MTSESPEGKEKRKCFSEKAFWYTASCIAVHETIVAVFQNLSELPTFESLVIIFLFIAMKML